MSAGLPLVEITYCRQCRWMLRAAWMAQELLSTFEDELGGVTLVPGTGGVFVVKVGDAVLVVDVGGGTTDFSVIAAVEKDGELALERVAVGEHILLGGDNMDLALAYTLNEKFKAQGKTLDAWQLAALTQACRVAKEALTSDVAMKKAPITVPGRGSSLIGGCPDSGPPAGPRIRAVPCGRGSRRPRARPRRAPEPAREALPRAPRRSRTRPPRAPRRPTGP